MRLFALLCALVLAAPAGAREPTPPRIPIEVLALLHADQALARQRLYPQTLPLLMRDRQVLSAAPYIDRSAVVGAGMSPLLGVRIFPPRAALPDITPWAYRRWDRPAPALQPMAIRIIEQALTPPYDPGPMGAVIGIAYVFDAPIGRTWEVRGLAVRAYRGLRR